MTSFYDVLHPLSSRLPLPQPARTRVLLEIAADLEDMYEHYRACGLSDEEARAKAAETFELADTALAELVRVHVSPFRRLLDRLSVQAASRWERALLAIVAAVLAIVGGGIVLRGEVFAVAGPLAWPALAAGAAGIGLGLIKYYHLYIKQDHEPRRARRGLDAIAGLAIAQVLLGFLAAWFGLYLAARDIAANAGMVGPHFFEWLWSSSALLSVGLMGALLTAIIWFGLARRVAIIADAEASLLMRLNGAEVLGGADDNLYQEK